MPITQAQGQEWSHLIFAGFNEGSWPPADKGDFAREEEIQNFNHSIRQLNRRAARQGSQGEGTHQRPPGSFALPRPSEQRQIAVRQFQTLLESAREGVAFSASLIQESAPERFWNANEMFTQYYQETHQKPLTQAAMNELQEATRTWLEKTLSLTTKVGWILRKIRTDARRL